MEMEDLLYRYRVADLWRRLKEQSAKKWTRLLEKEQELLTDLRWWPTVLSLLASPSTPFAPLAMKGMWLPPTSWMPSRATITVADVPPLAAPVYRVLSRIPPHCVGASGIINLLLATPDDETFAHQVGRLSSRMDDAVLGTFLTLAEEARWLGLEAFTQKVESLRQFLVFHLTGAKVTDLMIAVLRARTDREAAAHVVRVARTAPAWLKEGLEETANRANREEEMVSVIAWTLQKACVALEGGQSEAGVIGFLETWPPLQRYLAHQRLLRKAPFPLRAGEDWLARYGPRARAFLLQLGQTQGAQAAALFRLALAESEEEAKQAVAEEPHILSAQGEQQARGLTAQARSQGQITFSLRLTTAAERIGVWLAELVRPEQNPLIRLADRVHAGELDLQEALAQMQQPEMQHGLSILHLAALGKYATLLGRQGDLRRAETLAVLNYTAAQMLDNGKLRADAATILAEIKSDLGRYPEALTLFAEAVQQAEALDDPLRLILAVGPMGTAYRELGRYEEARRCYERARMLARTAGWESLEAAALGNLADLALLTGDLPSALTCSEQALARARGSGDRYQIAQSLATRAQTLHRAAQYDQALALYDEALEALHRIGDIGSEIRLRLNRGQAMAALGRLEEALAELEQVRQIAEEDGHWPLQAEALSAIGALYSRRGEPVRALDALEKALAIEGGLGPLERATTLLNIAAVQMALNQLIFAEEALNQAASTAEQVRNPWLDVQIALYRARYLAERKDWPQSEALARQVLEWSRQRENSELELWALELLGRASESQGRLEEAAQWYTRALDQARQQHRPAEVASCLLHLGIVQARLNQVTDAQNTLTEALTAAKELGLTYLQYYAHYNLGNLYDRSLNDLPQALEHYRAAIRLLEQERVALSQIEAFERQYLAGRQDIYRLAAEAAFRLHQPREALALLDRGRARRLARRIGRREALPATIPEELQARYDRTFQAVQFLRSVVYGEPGWGMRVMEEVRYGMKAMEESQTEEEIQRRVAEARDQDRQNLRRALAEAEAELGQIVQEIRQMVPDFDVSPELPAPDWEEIGRDPSTAVVALLVGDRLSGAVVLHPSGIRVVDLPDLRPSDVARLLYGLPQPLVEMAAQVQARIAQARALDDLGPIPLMMHLLTLRWMIEHPDSPEIGWNVAVRTLIPEKIQDDWLKQARRRMTEDQQEPREKTLFDLDDRQRLAMWQHLLDRMAGELKARLWGPLLPVLRDLKISQAVLIPDADLHTLPPALGLADEPDAPAVAIAPGLWLYAQITRQLRQREPRENTLMLIVNPTGDLHAADLEAGLLRDLFTAHGEATFTLSGNQATGMNVLRTSRVGNYWHFAGHARYEWFNPSVSGLRLANRETLPLFWIPMWMDFRSTRLVTLSACETGMTPVHDPEQAFEGLFSAFLVAGAPAVLASLWPVEQVSTTLLMHRFYQYHLGDLREGLPPRPPAVALRDAQQWLRTLRREEALAHPMMARVARLNPPRTSPVWEQRIALEDPDLEFPFVNPYFWAGFVLVGV